MAENKKLSGRQIKDLFYTEVGAEKVEAGGDPATPSTFRCRCGKLRSQSLKHGYTNLTQHVLMKHPDWVAAVADDATAVPTPDAAAAAVALQPPQKAKRGAASTKRVSAKKLRTARAQAGEDDSADVHVESASAVDVSVASGAPESVLAQEQAASLVTPVKTVARSDATPTQTPMAVPTPTAAPTPTSAATETSPPLPSSSSVAATATVVVPRPSVQKRADYLSWDDYFMSVAFLSAMRSKDPSTQVGACIVSPENKIVGIGYNGFPNGCNDDELPWARASATGSPLDTKYPYVCHAEMNAILNKNSTDVKGCTIYVALFPCNECAKLIIQSGITRVVYHSDKYNTDWKFAASRRLLDMAKVSYHQHQLQVPKLIIDFGSVE